MTKNEEKHVEAEEGEGNAHLGTFAILEAIYKGRNGFGEGEQKEEFEEIEQILDENFEKLKSLEKMGKTSIEQKILIEISEKSKNLEDNLIEELDKLPDMKLKEKRVEEFKNYIKKFEEEGQKRLDEEIKVEIDEKIFENLMKIKIHPFDFLQNVVYNVKIKPLNKRFEKLGGQEYKEIELLNNDKNIKSCYKLKEAIEIVISEEIKEDDDEMHKEFRGRLGAQILLSVYNAKEVTKEIANSMLINLAGSGLISTILDVFVWPPLLAIVAISCPALYIPLSVILYSVITNLFVNIADSLFLQRFLIMIEGGNFTPTTLEGFMNNLRDSWNVEKIAVGGSLLNNLIQMDTNWDMLGLDILSNEIASSTSSAILPFEYSVMKDLLRAGVYYKYKKGFFPKPSIEQLVLERRIEENSKNKQICKEIVQKLFVINKPPHSLTSELGITNEERNVAFSKYIKHKVSASMDIEKNSSMTINAMGIGAVLSLFGFLLTSIPSHFITVSSLFKKIIGILFNPSTQLLKFEIGYITANHLGSEFFENFWSTDTIRNKEMIKLIFDRSIKRLNGKNKNLVQITEKEVYDVYHPKMTITYGYGKGVVRIMNWMKRKLKKGYAFLTGKKFKLKLFEQINLSKIALDLFNEEEIEDSGFFQAKLDDLQLKMREMPGMDTDKWERFYEETCKLVGVN
uniref:Uncharacterized protein n=1 Tax=Meloidogyne javanica TaxID=6303 RepID=A0A915NFK5_MELJA